MGSSESQGAGLFDSLRAFADALSTHVARALRVRVPVFRAVVELTEREVYAAGEYLQTLRAEGKAQVVDLERICAEFEQATTAALAAVGCAEPLPTERTESIDAGCGLAALNHACQSHAAEHTRLAQEATSAARQVHAIGSELGVLGSMAATAIVDVEREAGHWGGAATGIPIVGEQLRQFSERLEGAGQKMAQLSEVLESSLDAMAQRADALQLAQVQSAARLERCIHQLNVARSHALQSAADALASGRARGERIARDLHALSAKLQFQDAIAQQLTALLNQEVASAKLLRQSLAALPHSLPERAQFEAEAIRAEHLSHALSAEERARRADAGESDSAQLEAEDAIFF